MPVEIIVPRLGWSMDEGIFAEWLKKDGEFVRAGDMVFVLEGEKASQEIESFDAGVLHIPPDAPQPGDTVVVGQLLGYLLATGESAPSGPSPADGPESNAAPKTPRPEPTSRNLPRTGSRVTATPRARRKARELGVDWSHVRGSGRNGRIRERDVLAQESPARSDVALNHLASVSSTPQPETLVRRTIAQRMMAGVHQTAPVTLTTKLNAGQLVAFRERLRAQYADRIVPTYTDILVNVVATSLARCAALNACWSNNGISLYDEVNIAFAVDTDDGLMAPVLKDVPSLTLEEIAGQTRTLAEQARAGQLGPAASQGGTFTITNLGKFDIDFFTPIINLPQSAILGVGRIVAEPVVEGGRVVPGKTMGLSLTFDHRVIDGAPAARWLQQLAKTIEQMDA